MLKINILTLYPQMFPTLLSEAIAGKAQKNKIFELNIVNIRDFATDKHRSVDDTPSGGGAGMVLRADVLACAIDSLASKNNPKVPRILLSPRGSVLTQQKVRELAKKQEITIICGRFEAVDERVIKLRNLEELSVGDYILSGGEPAAHILIDAIVRLLPGTMGNDFSAQTESFEDNLLEYPQYTRPRIFENEEIPEVLTCGNHQKIEAWRKAKSIEKTKEVRPDLYEKYLSQTINCANSNKPLK